MSDLSGARVLVVGAGVLGLAVAAEAALRGAQCLVFDPSPLGDNASGVAAGMLAPAFESALDPDSAGRFALFRAARDLWPGFSERHAAAAPERSGALWRDPAGEHDPAAVAAALRREGAGVEHHAAGVFTSDDWRIDPAAVLQALHRSSRVYGAEVRAMEVTAVSADAVEVAGDRVAGDAIVLCAGPGSSRFTGAAAELAVLRPIKGEILRFDGAEPRQGPTLRSPGGYLVPGSAGAVVGATMQAGVADRTPTPDAERALRRAAGALCPHLVDAPATHQAGVRTATPDALPLAGRSDAGVWLAVGARRNGWLLAPLVASIIVDALAGEPPGPWAEVLRPGRFG